MNGANVGRAAVLSKDEEEQVVQTIMKQHAAGLSLNRPASSSLRSSEWSKRPSQHNMQRRTPTGQPSESLTLARDRAAAKKAAEKEARLAEKAATRQELVASG